MQRSNRSKSLTAFLASTAIILTLGVSVRVEDSTDQPADNARVAELFNPAYLATAICRGKPARKIASRTPDRSVTVALARLLAAEPAELPPLFDTLGDAGFTVTTADPKAQEYFNQGLRFAYGFNHAEAFRAFQAGRILDPDCAMCYWGEALVLGPNINAPMIDAANGPALAAMDRALALKGGATAKEQALIDALAKRYSAANDRPVLDGAFADAMADVHGAYPDDPYVAVLYMEAMMDTQPWDYWEADKRTPKGRTQTVIDTAEAVLASHPDHPGAIHFYIHIMEASLRVREVEPAADRLGALMPGLGHMVHMPAHIYLRLGRYIDSLELNVLAVAADEVYLKAVEATGMYPAGYYPHNIHFVVTSGQMAGSRKYAIPAAEKLYQTITDEVALVTPWVQIIKAAPYWVHAQLSGVDEVMAQPRPSDDFPLVQAMWHYARGMAFAASGNNAAARTQHDAITVLDQANDWTALNNGGLPATMIMAIAGHVLDAGIAREAGNSDVAITALEAAIALQDALPYAEPPFWYYPIRQTLGAVLVEAGRPEEAEIVLLTSLMHYPNNAWAHFGLAAARRAMGDEVGAKAADQLFAKSWAGDPDWLTLDRL